jgi:hypothetical protein
MRGPPESPLHESLPKKYQISLHQYFFGRYTEELPKHRHRKGSSIRIQIVQVKKTLMLLIS